VQAWAERDLVAPWQGRIGRFEDDGLHDTEDRTSRWVGVPGMSALGRRLADGLEVRLETRVAPPRPVGSEWLLDDVDGAALGRFDHVIVAAPAPQAAELLVAAPRLAAQAACVDYTPCRTLMLVLEDSAGLTYDGIFVNQGPLRWVALNGSKPGRRSPASEESWVLQAGPDWSRRHLGESPETVEALMLEAFASVAGRPLPRLTWQQSHSWLYSLVDSPLESGCLWDADLGIGACGDWCNGARIEGAWLSGEAVAGRLLASVARE
jgi:predicted NAD/FAD-dependent oxidoreductase